MSGWSSPSRLANPYRARHGAEARSPVPPSLGISSGAAARGSSPPPTPHAVSPAHAAASAPPPTLDHPFGLRTRLEVATAAASSHGPALSKEGAAGPIAVAHAAKLLDSPTASLATEPAAERTAESNAEPSRLADMLSAGLAALEAGADFDIVELALREEEAAARAAEAAMAAATARLEQ